MLTYDMVRLMRHLQRMEIDNTQYIYGLFDMPIRDMCMLNKYWRNKQSIYHIQVYIPEECNQ